MTMLEVLVGNLLLYLFMARCYGNSSKMSLVYILSIYYVIISLLGIVVFETGIYENVFAVKNNKSFSIIPYAFCFYCLAALIYPLRTVSFNNISFKEIPYNKTTSLIINLWVVDMVCYMMLKLFQAVMASSIGYGEMYNISAVEGDAIGTFYGDNWLLLKFNNFNVNLYHSFSPFVMCYALYGLISRKMRRRKAFMLIGLILLTQILSALALGSRGNLFFVFWDIAFYFIIFYPHFDRRLKHKSVFVILCLIGIIMVYSIVISFARLEDTSTETPFYSVIRYFGEAFPNLGNLFWGEVTRHPYGTRLFPYLFGLTYIEESVQDGYAFWQMFTGVPVLNFKTIYGDLYIEFGEFLPLVIVTFISLLFSLFLGKRNISFWKMALVYWYFDLILQGVFGFNKGGQGNLVVFMAVLIFSFIVKIYTSNRSRI